ncbi:hypothetical protein [Pediococcus pentosaceus]|uniref:Uncharacterized protein n=1 Tax=Pediococcus pentosaceus TaxID=1255 RepID=A0ABD7X9Z3_PEDPE|nr:hypothetical protein [Pediococcus pentosaceus]WEA58234.1 hypothetical protein PWB86_09505 [Pediococcus pentosaceus]
MTMVGLISSNRQNPVPDRTKNPISIYPKTSDCEYCHAYKHDEWAMEMLTHDDFYNNDNSQWGKFIPKGDDMTELLLVIRMSDMKLYYDDECAGLCATGATRCPMCGRKLREDV